MLHPHTHHRRRRRQQRLLAETALLCLVALLAWCPLAGGLSLSVAHTEDGQFVVTAAASPWDWSGLAVPATSGMLRANGVLFRDVGQPNVQTKWDASFVSLPAAVQGIVALRGLNTTYADRVRVVSLDSSGTAVVWAVGALLDRPRVEFVSDAFWCAATLPAARDSAFQCRDLAAIADPAAPTGWAANFTSQLIDEGASGDAGTRATVSIQVMSTSPSGGEPVLPDYVMRQLLAIAFTRCSESLRVNTGALAARSHNDDRRTRSRIAVAFLWAFIVLTACFAAFVPAVWLPWSLSCSCIGDRLMCHRAIACMFVLLVSIFVGASAGEGLSGFVIVLALVLLATAAVGVTYFIVRAKHRHEPSSLEQRILFSVDEPLEQPQARAKAMVREESQEQELEDPEPQFEELEMEPGQLKDLGQDDTDQEMQLEDLDAGAPTQPSLRRASELPSPVQGETGRPAYESGAMDGGEEGPDPTGSFFDASNRFSLGSYSGDEDTLMLAGAAGAAAPPRLDDMTLVTVVLPPFSRYPHTMGARQRTLLGWSSLLVLVGGVVCVAIFGLWDVLEYRLYDRAGGSVVSEFIPSAIAKATLLVYAFDGFATRVKMNPIFFDVSTQWCGVHYSTALKTDAQKKRSLLTAFIEQYDIDMSMFVPSDYLLYSTVNQWFIRDLAPGVRPISHAADAAVVINPCDARLLVFAHMPADSLIWLKDDAYTVESMLGPQAYATADFLDSSMALARLAPQDYHQVRCGDHDQHSNTSSGSSNTHSESLMV